MRSTFESVESPRNSFPVPSKQSAKVCRGGGGGQGPSAMVSIYTTFQVIEGW